jgi:hypothetical protein
MANTPNPEFSPPSTQRGPKSKHPERFGSAWRINLGECPEVGGHVALVSIYGCHWSYSTSGFTIDQWHPEMITSINCWRTAT